jgi:hypothetical protein
VTDGQGSFSFIRPAGNRFRGWRCHGRWFGAQARCLGHRKLTRHFLRSLGNEVNPFCSPTTIGDGRWRAGDDEAVRAIFNDGGGDSWWGFGSRNSSSGGSDSMSSSSKQRFDVGSFSSTDRQARAWGSMAARWWKARTAGGLLLIGEKRRTITYVPGSLSLADSVEYELDSIFR